MDPFFNGLIALGPSLKGFKLIDLVTILTDFLAQSLLRYELSENPLKIATSLGKSDKMATAER